MDERGDIDFAGAYGRRVRGTYGAGEKRIINYKHAAPMELQQLHFVLLRVLGALVVPTWKQTLRTFLHSYCLPLQLKTIHHDSN